MARTAVTTTFYLDFSTGKGYRVSDIRTRGLSTLVVNPVEKDRDSGTWVIKRESALQHTIAELASEEDQQRVLQNNVSRWRRDSRWTEAVVNPDDHVTLRVIFPPEGVPGTVPFTIEP